MDTDTIAGAIESVILGLAEFAISFFGGWIRDGGALKLAGKIRELIEKIDWEELMKEVITAVGLAWFAIESTKAIVKATILGTILAWLGGKLKDAVLNKINENIDNWLAIFGMRREDLAKKLADIWQTVKNWFLNDVAPLLTYDYWEQKTNPIERAFGHVFINVANKVVDAMNSVISTVETALNKVVDMVNQIKVTDPFGNDIWSPNLQHFSFNRIPQFGDKSVVTPPPKALTGAANMPQNSAYSAMLQNTEWMDTFADKINGSSQDITINFTGSTSQLVRMLQPEIKKEEKRTGRAIIAGGAY